jgi:nicotinamidase-related amidase
VIGKALKKAMGDHPGIKTGKSFDHTAEPTPVPQKVHGKVEIAFKGFAEKVDSFGAFKYKKDYFVERAEMAGPYFQWGVKDSPNAITCAESWTGSFCLKCSSGLEDINAPPDVMAIKHTDLRALEDVVREHPTGRVVVCGLALDVCCQDTCVNAAKAGYKQVFMVLDACRAVNLPGIGQHEGYLTDPAWLNKKWQDHGIMIVETTSVLG